MKLLSYLKDSFVWCPVAINIVQYNNLNRIVYASLSIISSIITLITFGFVNFPWPYQYASYLIFKRCNERETK
jgi:hypothetical protein